MRHPFWLVNSILLGVLCIIILFILFSRPTIPSITSIEPSGEIKPIKKELTRLDVSKIYTNDLFNTYKSPKPVPSEKLLSEQPPPAPPQPKPPLKPIIPPIKFLEPLKIALRGIIVSSNERMNVAIIENTAEKKSTNYKIGDTIEDARLIRILKNKIILVRSNGQQEILYVNQHDTELEQLLLPQGDWSSIIKRVDDKKYDIYVNLFIDRIRNLSNLIDVLNLTTVYKEGKSIGCRIGKLEQHSLGDSLGFMQGDIITAINDLATSDISSRFEIYQHMLTLGYNDEVTVNITRKNQPISLHYTLKKHDQETPEELLKKEKGTPALEMSEKEKIKLLEKQYKFAPTLEELQKKEKENIVNMSLHPARINKNALTDALTTDNKSNK